ncbi:Dihydrolipoyllysine-residue acetyltransferase component of pyruvate dehydrogenase complex [Mycolicibacterium vanbaalenii]|uniref:Dihydrolipoamide acetyltransferase component of pyruvate dehydrogenase complex n=1 Tax=Mycolicibacterium vanbaalenii TaxID=110539 RepID=A0A5S9R591_MYCVN|nr:2-oxo acid dehydrogenase subunit E2 [Mycolicibacterium vanbaalenii]CAA0130002.1 Dihydrolipoyllysine-residue acetyltransferase component of pyruvate dehydrogenase complex [Mycolicibacterium vanbaalenii]
MSPITTQAGTTVALPALGEDVTEATVIRWLKTVGESVEAEEPLLEVATEKVDTEIPSPIAGILLAILVAENSPIEVGGAVAIIGGNAAEEADDTEVVVEGPAGKVATEFAPVSVAGADRVEKLPRIRRTIARRMVESLHTAAQLTTVVEVDVTAIACLRSREKDAFQQRTGIKLSFLPFFVAAAVKALEAHPVINSSLNPECTEVTYHGAVHLGIAVDSDKGLMVPVIRDAASLSITQLAQQIGDCADRVRTGSIRVDDLGGGTFTVTNTGSRGALFDTPILNQPQSAILGIGTVIERLAPKRGEAGDLQIDVCSMAYLSLSYDHRIVDGADAARYLGTVRQRLATGYDTAALR